MTRPLSTDLRQRLIGAVDGGMSRRGATSTAIKWAQQWREMGRFRPRNSPYYGKQLPSIGPAHDGPHWTAPKNVCAPASPKGCSRC